MYGTGKKRRIQQEYNEKNNITPQTIRKDVRDTIRATIVEDIQSEYDIKEEETIEELIEKLTEEMLKHAQNMEFEEAAVLRDKIKELENLT